MDKNQSLMGLLPPAELAKQYEDIQPGFLKWQMDMIEREAENIRQSDLAARDFDKQKLILEAEIIKRGQHFGLYIGLFALGAGAVTAILGSPISGGLIGTGGVIGLVSVFVFGRRSTKDGAFSAGTEVAAV